MNKTLRKALSEAADDIAQWPPIKCCGDHFTADLVDGVVVTRCSKCGDVKSYLSLADYQAIIKQKEDKMGFDMKSEAPEVPKQFKALTQGRMVRFAPQDGETRAAVVSKVIDKAEGIVELNIFWCQGDPWGSPAGVIRYHPEGKASTWHWPAHEG